MIYILTLYIRVFTLYLELDCENISSYCMEKKTAAVIVLLFSMSGITDLATPTLLTIIAFTPFYHTKLKKQGALAISSESER
jgi:hypothetical protein